MNTLDTIKRILAEKLDRSGFGDETTLDQLAIDSLDTLDLVRHIEEEFHIEIPDAKIPEASASIADLARMVDGLC